jgi:tRNA(Glu) U13 pseudouridine synthase TruD
MTPLKDFFVNEVAADPVDPPKHKVSMSFALYRGSYATVVLRELMKPRNLVKAGF